MSAPPPPYVMLSENQGSINGARGRPQAYNHRKVPRYQSNYYEKKPKGGSCCIKCICCCYCSIFFLVVALASFAFYFYTFYEPKPPAYNVQALDVKEFGYQPDFSLTTVLLVTVKAENPNSAIGFIYGVDSYVVVEYKDSIICSGKLPSFYQGHLNTTLMKVELKGKSEFGSGLHEAMQDNERLGKIPLLVKVKVPVSVVVGTIHLRQFDVFVNCSLVVDNLKAGKNVGILSSNYSFAFAF